jgi:phosphoadenosine phosphosulfate reductase
VDIAKEKRAIQYLKAFQPETEPYYLCYSGGKDSDTILALADLAGVKFEVHHNLTTVDAPETVRFVKSKSNVIIDYPHTSMWKLIAENRMPPTRLVRYCCEKLKERGNNDRFKITGVRAAESRNRAEYGGVVKFIGKEKTLTKIADEMGATVEQTKKGGVVLNMDNDENRRFVERCYRTSTSLLNPIIDWTDDNVLEFLAHYGVELNPLYEAVICKLILKHPNI